MQITSAAYCGMKSFTGTYFPLSIFQFALHDALVFLNVVLNGRAKIRLCFLALADARAALGFGLNPFRRRAVCLPRAQLDITMLPQGLFIPCFLWFPIRSAYITNPRHCWRGSSDTLGGIIARIIAHPLRSTVPGAVPGYLGISVD
jgi:hypothetical protein